MADVSEHDTEQERESDDAEDGRVDFFVGRNSVCVCDLLEGLQEFIGGE